MTDRRRRARFAVVAAFVALVCVGSLAVAMNKGTSGSEGLLPPLPTPETPLDGQSPAQPSKAAGRDEGSEHPLHEEHELVDAPAPGQAALAGPPASVARRFGRAWANRNTVMTPAIRREMVGLSAGAWAGAIFRQARLALPAIEGVRAEGDVVMMKLTDIAAGSKTALVLTEERLQVPDGGPTPPRYELYLARLDRVSPQGYAITAWEPQQ